MACDIELMNHNLKSMTCKELSIFKEAISKELELRRKEELNKLIINFKDAWNALEEYGMVIKFDDGRIDEILNLENIYYV